MKKHYFEMKSLRKSLAFAIVLLLGTYFQSFSQTGGFVLNGNATYVSASDYFRLTPASGNAFGSMWYNKRADLTKDFDITANLYFGTKDGTGADGIVFAFQDECTSSGSPGGSLGIGGVTPSLIVKYDVFQNTGDLADDHIAITKNGSPDFFSPTYSVTGAICALTTCGNIENGQYHKTRVQWIAATKTINVYFADVLRITYTGDIVANIFNGKPYVYWGFTAATGGFNNEQRVQIVQLPTNVIKLTNTQICQGDSKQLSLPGGTNYNWSPNIAISNTTISSPIISPTSSITYFVSFQDACSNIQRDTIKVLVNPYPVLNLSALSPSTICNGAAIANLTGVTPVGGTFSGLNVSANRFNPQSAPLGANTITYSLVNAFGCLSTSTAQITVQSTPTVSIPSFGTICQNNPSFSLTGGFPTGGTYSGTGVLSGNFSPSSSGAGNRTITYNYRDPSNGCTGTASTPIVVNPKPNSSFTASNASFCPDISTVTLTSNVANAAIYTWYLDDLLLTTTTSRTLAVSQGGSYKLKNTLSTGCSDTSSAVNIISNQPTLVSITSTTTTFCPSANVVLRAGTVAGGIFQWRRNGNNTGSASASPNFSANTAGDYTVMVTNGFGCSTLSSNSITLSQLTSPTVTVTANATKFCSGSSIDLKAKGIQGATYQWFRNTVSLGLAVVNDSIKNVNAAGTYYVVVTNTCPGISNNFALTSIPLVTNSGTTNTSTFCKGEANLEIVKDPVTNATTYLWDVIPAANASTISGQGSRFFYINLLDKNVTIKVTPANECGSGTPGFLELSPDNTSNCTGFFGDNTLFGAYPTTICPNRTVTFYNYTQEGSFTGTANWDFGPGASPATAIGYGPHTVTYSSTGLKDVKLDYKDQFGFSTLKAVTKTNYINVTSTACISIPTATPGTSPVIANKSESLVVYPVPNDGIFQIQMDQMPVGSYQLQVLNYAGAIVKNIPNYSGGQIQITEAPAGVYIVKMTQGDRLYQKIITKVN